MSGSLFNNKELRFVLQGVKALQQETISQKTAALQRMFPGDFNLDTVIEFYDKRTVELHHLETKILGMATTLG